MAKSKIIKPKVRLPHKPTKVHQDRTKRIPRKQKYKETVSASVEEENFNSLFTPGDLVVKKNTKFTDTNACIHRIIAVDFAPLPPLRSVGIELVYLAEVHFIHLNVNEQLGVVTKPVKQTDKDYRKLNRTEELLFGPRIKAS